MVVCHFGGVSEWSKETVLKTVGPYSGLVGSNPTPSAPRCRWAATLTGVSFGNSMPAMESKTVGEWAEYRVAGTLYDCGLLSPTIGEVAEWSKALAC